MIPSDIIDDLKALIDDFEKQAEELSFQEPFIVHTNACSCFGPEAGVGHVRGCGDEPGALWWVIEKMRRDVREDRNQLEVASTLMGIATYHSETPGWPSEMTAQALANTVKRILISVALRYGEKDVEVDVQ